MTMSEDTRVVFDPETYVTGVPYDALARLRRRSPVVWVEEVPVLGWPGGPGFWLVLRHADVESVMRRPALFPPGWARRRSATRRQPRHSATSAG